MKTCPNCKEEMPDEHDICWNCNYDLIDKNVLPVHDPRDEEVKSLMEDQIDLAHRSLNCLRCDSLMSFAGEHRFHEGANWGILGDLGHLFTNSESFDVNDYMTGNDR